MRIVHTLPVLLLLATGQTLAQTPLDLHHAARADARVSVSNVAGVVTVEAWDRNEVQVTGTLGSGSEPLQIEGDEAHLKIEVKPQGGGGWFHWKSDSNMAPSTLHLMVPRGASLQAEVVSADLTVDGLSGGTVDADAVSGKVRIDAHTPKLSAQTVSGHLEARGHADQADLQTVSGDIVAPALGARAELETVSGGIQADGGPWEKLSVSTVSGDVRLAGSLARQGNVDIDSMSGDVELRLPADLSAALDASSFSGDLRSDFGQVSTHEHGPGSELKATVGGGEGHIHAESFSGDLTIRRQ